jgi:hypothetical protein
MIKLRPCPFCEGPPVPIAVEDGGLGGGSLCQYKDRIPEEGLLATAFVFCHECGVHGPRADADLYFNPGDELPLLQEAVNLWNQRDNRHRDLYDLGEQEGLNDFPRRDDRVTTV